MKYTIPTRMDTPNPESERDAYFSRRIITQNQIELHWHQFYEIDFIDEGHGKHILNGAERGFSRGSFSVLTPYDFHAYNLDLARGDHLSVYSFHFSESVPDPNTLSTLKKIAGRHLFCPDEESLALITREFALLFSESAGDGYEKDALVRNILARITIYFQRCIEDSDKERIPEKPFPEIEFIEKNFRSSVTIAETAKAAGFSEDYFSKLFKRRYGITFGEYLMERRLQWAYRLLHSSNRSITEIAYESGFNSHTYFARCFKSRYGITPNEERQRASAFQKTE